MSVKKKKPKKRASVPRPYNDGTMSEAEFKSFIISTLRKASIYWKPKARCIREARVGRNQYKCELCWKIGPSSLPPLPWKKRKRKNIQADHIEEVVNIKKWFEWFEKWIERCFVERSWFQAICYECHSVKTAVGRLIAKQRKIWTQLEKKDK